MDNTLQERFKLSRPFGVVNEAATFVENNIVLATDQLPVYAEQLDQFVSVEEGIKQQQIRYIYTIIMFSQLQSNVWASAALWKAADAEKDKLFGLMEQVQTKLSKKSKGNYTPLDLSTCKWGDVMSEVQNAGQRWKSMPGPTAKARRCLERLGEDSGAFSAWLNLLPAGDYGSRYLHPWLFESKILTAVSICGVFKLAVGVSGQRKSTTSLSGKCTD